MASGEAARRRTPQRRPGNWLCLPLRPPGIHSQTRKADRLENGPASSYGKGLKSGPSGFLLIGLIAFTAGIPILAGCAASPAGPTAVPTWELANAEPFAPTPVGRGRISFDRPLPPHLLQELCPEFTLVVIRTAKDWRDVQRRLQLASPPLTIDLSQGSVVGLVANVGESMDDRWPISFRCLRRCGTEGSLEAAFLPGVYYPMLTASYVDLVYAPGIRTIGLVAIDARRFVIRSPAAH